MKFDPFGRKEIPRSFIMEVQGRLRTIPADGVTLRSEWCRLSADDDNFTFNVPVSADLVLPLRARYDFDLTGREAELPQEIDDFARALVNISRGRDKLIGYAKSVRDGAIREIEKVRAGGVDLRFERVSFKPTLAHFLGQDDLAEALSFVMAQVHLSVLQPDFRRETMCVLVEDAEDISDDIRPFAEEQEENQLSLDRQQSEEANSM